jgi:hypothetical protein
LQNQLLLLGVARWAGPGTWLPAAETISLPSVASYTMDTPTPDLRERLKVIFKEELAKNEAKGMGKSLAAVEALRVAQERVFQQTPPVAAMEIDKEPDQEAKDDDDDDDDIPPLLPLNSTHTATASSIVGEGKEDDDELPALTPLTSTHASRGVANHDDDYWDDDDEGDSISFDSGGIGSSDDDGDDGEELPSLVPISKSYFSSFPVQGGGARKEPTPMKLPVLNRSIFEALLTDGKSSKSYRVLTQLINDVFSSQEAIISNFVRTAENSPKKMEIEGKKIEISPYESDFRLDLAVNMEDIAAMYSLILEGLCEEDLGANCICRALISLAYTLPFSAPSVKSADGLIPFIVILENPELLDPKYEAVIKNTLLSIDKLSHDARNALHSWVRCLDFNRYTRCLDVLRQHITLKIFAGSIEEGRPAVRFIEMFYHCMDSFPEITLADFYNDAITDYLDSDDGKLHEFRLWMNDRVNSTRPVPYSSSSGIRINSSGSSSSSSSSTAARSGFGGSGLRTATFPPSPARASSDPLSSIPSGASDPPSPSQAVNNPRLASSYNAQSFISYPFVLTPGVKAEILAIESRTQMRDQMRDRVTHAMMTGGMVTAYETYMILRIRREAILLDTLSQLTVMEPSDFKKPLKVIFDGEEGIDAGGVRKEYFMLMTKLLLAPDYGMFKYYPDVRLLWFNPDSLESTQEFKLIGMLVGLAIYNSINLDLSMPSILYKKLKGLKPTLEYLAELQPSLAQGLQQLLDFEGTDEEIKSTFGLNFQISFEVWGDVVTKDLVPNAENIEVDSSNRHEYVEAYVNWILEESVKTQFEAFAAGFVKVCGGAGLDLFHQSELELLICGNPVLDFEELKRGTEYEDGFIPTDRVIIEFWQILSEFNEDQKKLFLKFTTGSDRSPVDGLYAIGFKISRNGDDDERLPSAHTCFNHLLLPDYSNKDVLKAKLLLSIENSEGFGLQ